MRPQVQTSFSQSTVGYQMYVAYQLKAILSRLEKAFSRRNRRHMHNTDMITEFFGTYSEGLKIINALELAQGFGAGLVDPIE